jgi:hypothetical protein
MQVVERLICKCEALGEGVNSQSQTQKKIYQIAYLKCVQLTVCVYKSCF